MTVSTQGSNFYIVTTGVYDSGKERVLAGVKYESSRPDIFTVSETGAFEVKKEGTGILKVTYTDKTIEINVTVTDLAFLLDSSFKRLAGENSLFSAETNTLTITGTEIYGWGDDDVNTVFDLSKYKYMVLDLKEPVSADADFSISKKVWDSPSYNLRLKPSDTDTRYVIALTGLKANTRTNFGEIEMDKISVVGFQGAMVTSTIKIDRVFVTNDWPYGDDVSVNEISVEGLSNDMQIPLNSKTSFTVKAKLSNGQEIDATSGAIYSLTNSNDFNVAAGEIWSEVDGAITNLTIKFGPVDKEKEVTITNIKAHKPSPSDFFPLTEEGFKVAVNINNNTDSGNTFNATTKAVNLQSPAGAGWTWDTHQDFSEHKYLIVELEDAMTDNRIGVVVENEIGHASKTYFVGNKEVIIDLDNMMINWPAWSSKLGQKVNPSSVSAVAFNIDWGTANSEFKIKDVRFADEYPGSVSNLEITGFASSIANGQTMNIKAIATIDGVTRDVTYEAEYRSSNTDVVRFLPGEIKGLSEGTSTITVEFQGYKFEQSITVVNVSENDFFPIVGGYFKPNLGDTSNEFNYTTKELTINNGYSVSGWTYDNGISISGNNYLVAKYKAGTGGYSDAIRLLLGNGNIYGPCYRSGAPVMVGDYYYLVVKLSDVTETNTMEGDQNVAMDLTSIKTIGLQHFTGNTGFSIIVDEVYLSDTDPTASSNRSN